MELNSILTVARSTVWRGAAILRDYYHQNVQVMDKQDGPVTAADIACNNYILEKLQAALGVEEFGYLSEETYQGGVIAKPWVWVIDPLDGTRDFIDKTGEYAIHLALCYQHRPVLAVVAIPEAHKILYAIKNKGAFVESSDGSVAKLQVSGRDKLELLYLVASRTHRGDRLQNLIDSIPFQGRNYVGSVGCKVASIVEGHSDVYISLSGKSAPKDWDFAAPELILTEAGGEFTMMGGEALTYNNGDVQQWGCQIASNGHCHTILCQQAREILGE